MASESTSVVDDALAVANIDDGDGIMMREFAITNRSGFQTLRVELVSRFNVSM